MPSLKYRKTLEQISSYVPAKSLEVIEKELGLDKIIRLSANENTRGCSPLVQEALQKASKDMYLYPDGFCMKLRNKLAETLKVEKEQLVFGNGSFELIELIAQIFLDPGDESIISEPSFGWYKVVTLAMNGVVKSVPLKNHSVDLEAVKNNITDKTKIIWICNPSNPTGTTLTRAQLEQFLEEVPPHIAIVLDEAYYEFVTNKDYPESIELLDKHKNIIILRTFSKVYGLASYRIGYGIASPEMINVINKIRLPINVSAAAQIAALASLEDKNFKREVIEGNIEGKEYYYKAFNELNLEYIPTDTNFIMVNIKKDSVAIANEILKRGIALRAGLEFGMPTWLRITIGKPEENELVIEKLREVLDIL